MEFAKAIQVICDAGVDFVVIGGLSATFHGSARVTYDLDIRYSRASENVLRLTAALAPFHPRPRGFPDGLPFVWDERTLRNVTVLKLQTDVGAIDLLAEVAGLGAFDQVKEPSIMVEAFERHIATLDLPGLFRQNEPRVEKRISRRLPNSRAFSKPTNRSRVIAPQHRFHTCPTSLMKSSSMEDFLT